MTAPTEADFTAVTTRSKRLRHWALTSRMRTDRSGRAGSTLCDTFGRTGLDQERLNDSLPTVWRGTRYVIVDMPPCKVCEASKARRIAGRPS